MTPVFNPPLASNRKQEAQTFAAYYDRHASLTEIVNTLPGVQSYVSLKQVHGATVKTIDELTAKNLIKQKKNSVSHYEADACVTKTRNLLLSVHTADCVPLLAAAGAVIGACHAGWRGVSLGVVENFVAAMGALGAAKNEIKMALGPAIGPCHFEVKKDVTAQLLTRDIPERLVSAIKLQHADPEKDFIDLRELVRFKLLRLGLSDQNIFKSVDCTYCDESRFFSYRRDSAQKGRLEGVIVNQL